MTSSLAHSHTKVKVEDEQEEINLLCLGFLMRNGRVMNYI